MNKIEIYNKSKNKTCSICNKDIPISEIIQNKVEITITKRRSIIFAHKDCINWKG